jgi:hypothetical protein
VGHNTDTTDQLISLKTPFTQYGATIKPANTSYSKPKVEMFKTSQLMQEAIHKGQNHPSTSTIQPSFYSQPKFNADEFIANMK